MNQGRPYKRKHGSTREPSRHESHAGATPGGSANASPSVTGKRQRASGVGLTVGEEVVEVNGVGSANKVKAEPKSGREEAEGIIMREKRRLIYGKAIIIRFSDGVLAKDHVFLYSGARRFWIFSV